MKKFFNNEVREKEKDKIIELNFDVKFEDIKECFEEVDVNGEEKSQDEIVVDDDKKTTTTEEEKKKKKKKNKKK
jgi:hypothetical protein